MGHCQALFSELAMKATHCLLLGDFNICAEDKQAEDVLNILEFSSGLGFTQHVTFPTHQGGHMLDLVFSRNMEIGNVKPLEVPWSDHVVLLFDIQVRGSTKPPPVKRPDVKFGRVWGKIDAEDFGRIRKGIWSGWMGLPPQL